MMEAKKSGQFYLITNYSGRQYDLRTFRGRGKTILDLLEMGIGADVVQSLVEEGWIEEVSDSE